ncbi:Imidazole glycerol phosphate synthase subunit HisF [Fundidesulfovibrio magnetotacticus]|uniref:imidazole glycerol-phosphate synthase n=1 Tax=Fundidesulfovibrio magnetotacticus TaxID=2730080 RepID=A0A6V8LYY2_9BACT|nr:imidazole glycerol phosphate synthase cyclase subunit [Fundidesulfovibrio magnetotacticus]GFK94857.1 Imidazole glycerol phosphate synthase subunit HisF [Fundidesulfovibrio magnetotacticus]
MLKRRIIPKLQMRASRFGSKPRMVLVTTRGFEESLEMGDPVSQAKIFEAQAADELIFLDLDAQDANRATMIDVVRRAAEEIFMPFTVGGGVRSTEDFKILLDNGADKVSVNTAALESPGLITAAARIHGAQCVVLSIDYREEKDGRGRVYSHGGKTATDWDPADWAARGQELGAGEILLTCIGRDGSRQGLDTATCRRAARAVGVPLIAAGGCGLASHFVEGFQDGLADAVAAGTYFFTKDENIMQIRSRIHNAGIPIRLNR